VEYLQYWKHVDNAETLATGEGLEHTAGNQLGKVRSGDTIWIVTFISGRLYLVGRIVADVVVKRSVAERMLHNTNLWKARYHVVARRETISPLRTIGIERIAKRLRFLGEIDRLPPRYTGRSFQTLRTLTPATGQLLRRRWAHGGPEGGAHPRVIAGTIAAIEGAGIESVRYVQGRSKTLRIAALARAAGRCETCARNYSRLLGGMGVRVLQVHHRRQLAASDAPRLTRVEDLAVLCANCHALVHMNPQHALGVDELRRWLRNGSDSR
jgi:hypothetical protein